MANLRTRLLDLIRQSGAEAVGVALSDCATRRGLSIQPDLSFHPASTFKLCVMMEVFHQAQQDRLALDEPLEIHNRFHSLVDDSPFSLSPGDDSETDLYARLGARLPVEELVRRMIQSSSNLATNLLIERVTPAAVDAYMRRLGARGLLVRRGVEDNLAFARGWNNAATPRGLMQVLRRLAAGRVVSRAASAAMIAVLLGQRFNEGIPAGLPAGTRVAHKTGWNGLLYHDAAIVYPPEAAPYVLVVMTRGLSDQKEAPELVAAMARCVHDQWAVVR
jgi:beta-lactamase class A